MAHGFGIELNKKPTRTHARNNVTVSCFWGVFKLESCIPPATLTISTIQSRLTETQDTSATIYCISTRPIVLLKSKCYYFNDWMSISFILTLAIIQKKTYSLLAFDAITVTMIVMLVLFTLGIFFFWYNDVVVNR